MTLPGQARSIALILACGTFISSCATQTFVPTEPDGASFVERRVTQDQGHLRVSASVLAREEVNALLGVDLYTQGIQPLWLQVENRGPARVRVALESIDDDYFSPLEVAWMNRKAFRRGDRAALEQWFYENGLNRSVPAGETVSGFVYTNGTTGTKGFNVDVYAAEETESFTFFLQTPGFVPDYMNVDFTNLYTPEEIQHFSAADLPRLLTEPGCCSTDQSGTQLGDPFNIVLVGSGTAVLRALLRAGWRETETDGPGTEIARTHYYRGRTPDGVFERTRANDARHRELRLWLAPMQVGDDIVWLGQASYDLTGRAVRDDLTDYRQDPDIDDARMFVMQSLWYAQSLERVEMVAGAPAASVDTPHRNFNGATYFTDGQRAVLFVSEAPIAMDETILLEWGDTWTQ